MTEAGWYEDPEGHGRGRRYWDGSSWTEHYEHAAAEQAPAQQAPAVQQQPAQQLPPAGWKDDPEGGPGMRYWDGSQWTDHYHPPRDTAQQPAAGGFQPAGQAFQPATGSEPAVASSSGQQVSSLDETQLDVRGYHGGRDEPETADSAAEPEASSSPEVADAPADATPEAEAPAESTPEAAPVDFGDDRTTTDYGNAGDTSFCENCGAKIRSSHKFCPACGHKQEGLPS